MKSYIPPVLLALALVSAEHVLAQQPSAAQEQADAIVKALRESERKGATSAADPLKAQATAPSPKPEAQASPAPAGDIAEVIGRDRQTHRRLQSTVSDVEKRIDQLVGESARKRPEARTPAVATIRAVYRLPASEPPPSSSCIPVQLVERLRTVASDLSALDLTLIHDYNRLLARVERQACSE